MSSKTNTLENLLTDLIWRGQTITMGGTTFTPGAAPSYRVGLLGVSAWNASQSVSLGVFIVRPDAAGTLHLLKCTTAGITAGSAPTAPSANDGTVTDGAAVWTDQYTALEAATVANINGTTLPAELSGGTYARQTLTGSLAAMAGTQSAGSTTASSGTNATTSNNAAITFNSGGSAVNVGLYFITDAAATNVYEYAFITGGPVAAASGATLTFAAGALTIQEDN